MDRRILLAMAAAHPENVFIGIDITFKRVVETAERALERKLQNASVLLLDAQNLSTVFPVGQLDGILCFFPDPWNKKRSQSHRRLLQYVVLEQLFALLQAQGFFWFKTDCPAYYDLIRESLQKLGCHQREVGPDLAQAALLSGSYTSTYEKKFLARNVPTYSEVWFK